MTNRYVVLCSAGSNEVQRITLIFDGEFCSSSLSYHTPFQHKKLRAVILNLLFINLNRLRAYAYGFRIFALKKL